MKASDNTCSATLTPGDRHRDLAYPVFLATYQRFQTSNPSRSRDFSADGQYIRSLSGLS